MHPTDTAFHPGPASTGAVAPTSGVCAVVVTFHPDDGLAERLAVLRPQVGALVVVDNGSGATTRARLRELAAAQRAELVLNDDNRGIAAALNQGFERATSLGYPWVATFDQDSRVGDDFLAGLFAAQQTFRDRDKVAIVAPLYRDRHLGRVSSPSGPLAPEYGGNVPVPVTATSGNVVRVAAWRAIGGFREDFFIDCVDFEFCLRVRRHGWIILEARGVELDHAQGHYERRKLLWRQAAVNDYSASRRYYQARNRLVLYARYGWFDPGWIFRDAIGHVSDVTKMLLFAKDRGTKVRALLLGYWHAVSGRRGRWVDERDEGRSR